MLNVKPPTYWEEQTWISLEIAKWSKKLDAVKNEIAEANAELAALEQWDAQLEKKNQILHSGDLLKQLEILKKQNDVKTSILNVSAKLSRLTVDMTDSLRKIAACTVRKSDLERTIHALVHGVDEIVGATILSSVITHNAIVYPSLPVKAITGNTKAVYAINDVLVPSNDLALGYFLRPPPFNKPLIVVNPIEVNIIARHADTEYVVAAMLPADLSMRHFPAALHILYGWHVENDFILFDSEGWIFDGMTNSIGQVAATLHDQSVIIALK
jgi:hypothetical protein